MKDNIIKIKVKTNDLKKIDLLIKNRNYKSYEDFFDKAIHNQLKKYERYERY